MAKRILFCATVDYHFQSFHLPMMEWFQTHGWEVHVAAKGDLKLPYTDRKYNLSIERSPFRTGNWRAYLELKKLLNEQHYDIVHCHTPVGGFLTRLAARKTRASGTKVIYTAHGFHFYKGAPMLNWLAYYPVEKWMANWTDCLITINGEDYRRALKSNFRAGSVSHVHGVGVQTSRYAPIHEDEKKARRESYGYHEDEFLVIYTAEFNENKNHQLLLHIMASLKDTLPQAKLLFAGRGELLDACMDLAEKLEISSMVDFLGYRNDLDVLLPMCDVAVSASIREGLPVNIMEAMACGLPIVATANRGHEELIIEGKNGFLVPHIDAEVFASRLRLIHAFQDIRLVMGRNSLERVKMFSQEKVMGELEQIYKSLAWEVPDETQDQYHRAYI